MAAELAEPVDRYPHRVLGDRSETAALVVTLADGSRQTVRWPPGMVFEDTVPRLADLDGDGAPEVVTVESSATEGARVAVYGLRDGRLTRLAATPHIGTRFRWIAIVGAADLDGDGVTEIAAVDRPHLARTLRVWRWQPGPDGARLRPVAALEGVTNHRIGERDIAGGIRDCGAGPEMVLADRHWRHVVAVRLDTDGALMARDIGAFRGPDSLRAAMDCTAR